MALDPCIPCGCDPAVLMLDSQSAQVTIGRILCQLLAELEIIAGSASASATVTSVDDSNVVQTLLAANAARSGFILQNDSDQIAYVKLGAAATVTDYSVQLGPGDSFVLPPGPVYQGVVTGIWAANSTGAMKITEFTI